jgi:hypothetical protein
MQRIRIVVDELVDYANKNADKNPLASHLWVVSSMFESVTAELTDATDEKLALWIDQFGKLLQWCATGDYSNLPPEVVEHLQKTHANLLALEA